MKQYRGIIFNSKNVETLSGSLGQAVRERNIRTAVVSRKNRMEVRRMLKATGVKVEVIVGGLDLNTRYTQFVKPMSDPMLIAVAMMHLEAEDIAVLGDYFGDRRSAFAAGLDYYTRPVELMARQGGNPAETKVKPDYSGFKVPVTGIIGAICGDVIGSAYEFHPTEDYNFAPFVRGTHVTDDSVATLAVAKCFLQLLRHLRIDHCHLRKYNSPKVAILAADIKKCELYPFTFWQESTLNHRITKNYIKNE